MIHQVITTWSSDTKRCGMKVLKQCYVQDSRLSLLLIHHDVSIQLLSVGYNGRVYHNAAQFHASYYSVYYYYCNNCCCAVTVVMICPFLCDVTVAALHARQN